MPASTCVEVSYAHDLRNLSAALGLEAERARQHRLFTLAKLLRTAADEATGMVDEAERAERQLEAVR